VQTSSDLVAKTTKLAAEIANGRLAAIISMFFQRRAFGFKAQTSSDLAARTTKLAAEIANGRRAMAAIISMFFQSRVSGFKVQTSSDLANEDHKARRVNRERPPGHGGNH
jgi:hypothetical protein